MFVKERIMKVLRGEMVDTNLNEKESYMHTLHKEKKILLDGKWDFAYTPPGNGVLLKIPNDLIFDTQIDVPGYWDDQLESFKNSSWWKRAVFEKNGGFAIHNYLCGIGWYRRYMEVPAEWANKTIILELKRIMVYAHLWVNGKFIECDSQYTAPFSVDISEFLISGKRNEIIIAVRNDKNALSLGRRWNVTLIWRNAGILDTVYLKVTDKGFIDDLFVRAGADLETVDWTVTLQVPTETRKKNQVLLWSIRPKDGSLKKLAQGKVPFNMDASKNTQVVEWSSVVENIKHWSPEEPNLYIAELSWESNGTEIDSSKQSFGIRKWASEGYKLKLNNKTIYLRGTMEYSMPYPRNHIIPKGYYQKVIKRLKEIGFNYMGIYDYPPQEFFDAADELGMIVQIWLFSYPGYNNTENKKILKRIKAINKWLRNHPSVSIYYLAGERYCNEKVISEFQKQYELIKKENPEVLVLPSHASRGIEYAVNLTEPHTLYKPFVHNADRLRSITTCSDVIGQYPGGILSYSCLAKGTWQEMEERASIYKKPLLSHELCMIASYLDLRNEKHYTGENLYSELRKRLKAEGLVNKASLYYEKSALVQQAARKYCIEKTRFCNSLAGYEYLGARDKTTLGKSYLAGIFDELLQLKPGDSNKKILKYNNENVLLLDFEDRSRKRCFWSEQFFNAAWVVSLYGKKSIKKGKISWMLKDGEKVLLENEEIVNDVPTGEVSLLTSLRFRWPELDTSKKLTLQGILTGSGYKIENEWDFWIFPKRKAPTINAICDHGIEKLLKNRHAISKPGPSGKLKIVSRLTAEDICHLERGGDILLLGTKPFPTWQLYRPLAVGHSSVRDHQVGTIIHAHPIFKGIPNQGFGDWQFYPMLREFSDCVVFNKIDIPFNPILEVISSDKHIRKQACIFEMYVGKGKLFVYTCNIDKQSPSCITVIDSILDYVQGKNFDPAVKVMPEVLRKLPDERKDKEPRFISCVYTERPPVIDGMLEKEIWDKSNIVESNQFFELDGQSEAERAYNAGAGAGIRIGSKGSSNSAFRAKIRALHDEENIYLAIEVFDRDFCELLENLRSCVSSEHIIVRFIDKETRAEKEAYSMALGKVGHYLSGSDRAHYVNVAAQITEGKICYEAVFSLKNIRANSFLSKNEKIITEIHVVHKKSPASPEQCIVFYLELKMGFSS